MQLNEDFPDRPMENFESHYVLFFSLASLGDAAEPLHYPELSVKLSLFLNVNQLRFAKMDSANYQK